MLCKGTAMHAIRIVACAASIVFFSYSTDASATSDRDRTGASRPRASTNARPPSAGQPRLQRKYAKRAVPGVTRPQRRFAFRDRPFGFADGIGLSDDDGPGCWDGPQYQRLYRWQGDCNGFGFGNGFDNGFGADPFWGEE